MIRQNILDLAYLVRQLEPRACGEDDCVNSFASNPWYRNGCGLARPWTFGTWGCRFPKKHSPGYFARVSFVVLYWARFNHDISLTSPKRHPKVCKHLLTIITQSSIRI
jgi:hypothetical protein